MKPARVERTLPPSMLIASEPSGTLHVAQGSGELAFLTWTASPGAPSSEARVYEAYLALDAALADLGAVPIQERVFAGARAAAAVADGRAAAVTASSERWRVPPTVVAGAPAAGGGLAGIHVVGARGRSRLLVHDDLVLGRLVEGRHARVVGLADVGRSRAEGRNTGPAQEAGGVLEAAATLLAREGFAFPDVVRTWFYLRDILGWYGAFNTVRNAFFATLGLAGANGAGRIPASTGIEGRNARGNWCTLDLVAVQAVNGGELHTRRLHNRRQNEATEYGSAFARALELVLGEARHVLVSGTAAIDDRGASVHTGDFERQVGHTLEAVEALLGGAGARLSDVCQATAFLKRPADAPAWERLVARSGIAGVPIVTTVADVCREDLLFEIDATAVVPVARRGRG